jgi:hypothetical protein
MIISTFHVHFTLTCFSKKKWLTLFNLIYLFSEKKLRMAEKVREMMEAEKVLLLAEGLNPYIEFRSREVEAEV